MAILHSLYSRSLDSLLIFGFHLQTTFPVFPPPLTSSCVLPFLHRPPSSSSFPHPLIFRLSHPLVYSLIQTFHYPPPPPHSLTRFSAFTTEKQAKLEKKKQQKEGKENQDSEKDGEATVEKSSEDSDKEGEKNVEVEVENADVVLEEKSKEEESATTNGEDTAGKES